MFFPSFLSLWSDLRDKYYGARHVCTAVPGTGATVVGKMVMPLLQGAHPEQEAGLGKHTVHASAVGGL